MNERKQEPKRRHIRRSLTLFCLSLLVAAFCVSCGLGWISFHQGDVTFTIEVRTGKAKQDTNQALEKSKDVTVGTGKVLQRAGKKLEELGGKGEARPSDSSAIDEPTVAENGREPREQSEYTKDDSYHGGSGQASD